MDWMLDLGGHLRVLLFQLLMRGKKEKEFFRLGRYQRTVVGDRPAAMDSVARWMNVHGQKRGRAPKAHMAAGRPSIKLRLCCL